MCDFKILHQSECGYVMQCRKCNHIQTAFGNFCIAQTEQKFHELVRAVADYYHERQHDPLRNSRSIYLNTPARNINLVFTVNELEQLYTMLQEAAIMVEAENILLNRCG